MSNRKKENDWLAKINIKPKGRNSFSLPKRRNPRRQCRSKTMTTQHHSQEKENKTWRGRTTNKIETSSSSATDSSASSLKENDSTMEQISDGSRTESSMDDDDDDEWLTDTSIEKMRSSEFLTSDGVVIDSPKPFSLSNLEPQNFLPPACSTPRFLPDVVKDCLQETVPKASTTLRSDAMTQHGEPQDIPDVNYEDTFLKESLTLEDENFHLKSMSLEQYMQLPDIPDDVIKESQEQREGEDLQFNSTSLKQNMQLPDIPDDVIKESQEQLEGSFSCSKVKSSVGFKIFEDSVECIKQDFDKEGDRYIKNNPFESIVIDKSTNFVSKQRKQEDNERSSFEDMNVYSSREETGDSQSMQIDSSEGKYNSVFNRINDSITRWKQKHDGKNLLEYKSDSEDNIENVQKIQNKKLQGNELGDNKPQTGGLRIKRKVKIFLGDDDKIQVDDRIRNRSQNSSSLGNYGNEGKYSHEDIDKSAECFENIQNEEVQDNETDNSEQENAQHQTKTNDRVKFASILNRSTNSNKKEKHRNKIIYSSGDVDIFSRANNFKEAETPKRKGALTRNIKLNYSNYIKTPQRMKHANEGRNSFDDIDKNYSENRYENVQNIQNVDFQEKELDNNQPETVKHQIIRKIKHLRVDNIRHQDDNNANRTKSSFFLKSKQENEDENSFEKVNKRNKENSFENAQKVQNKELQEDELDSNYSQSVSHQVKINVNVVYEDNKKRQDDSTLNTSLNSISLRRKYKNEGGNSFENTDKNDDEDSNKKVQNIQNEGLQHNGLENNQPKTVKRQGNRKYNENLRDDNKNIMQQNANIFKRLKISISLRKEHENEDENLFEDVDKDNNENSFKKVQRIRNKEMQNYELGNSHPQTVPHQIKTKVNMYLGIDDRSQQDASILNRSSRSTSLKTKHNLDGENSFEGMNKNDREDCFENVQNMQDEELQDNELDNHQPETVASQINRKVNNDAGVDNTEQQTTTVTNTSQISTSLRRTQDNGDSLFEDADKNGNEESFENFQTNQNDRENVENSSVDKNERGDNFEKAQNMENNTPKKKGRSNRRVGVKTNRRYNRSQKAAYSLNRSKSFTGRKVPKDVQNNSNKVEKTNWPRCCIEEAYERDLGLPFPILKPVFRNDVPIDSITLVNLGIESKMNCKH